MPQAQSVSTPYVPQPPPVRPEILLIDSNIKRQFGRAAGLRMQGVTVTCAKTGADAYSLWEPELYKLVLIDFRGADSGIRGFYHHIKALPNGQRIGLYCSAPPFILYSATATEPPADGPPLLSAAGLQKVFDTAAHKDTVGHGLTEAARRIASLKTRKQAPARVAEPAKAEPRVRESNASIAERVLGGSE